MYKLEDILLQPELPTIHDSASMTLIIKPTHKCNMACEYCYDKPNRKRLGDVVMPLSDVEEIIKRVPDNVCVTWIWHGGECTTIEPDYFRQASNIAKKYFRKNIEFQMQSNGFKVSDEFMQMCKESKISIGFSFDFDAQEYRNLKSKENNNVIDTLARAAKWDLNSGTLSVIHAGNIHRMIDMYEDAKNIYHFQPAFNHVFETEGVEQYGLKLDNDLFRYYIDQFVDHLFKDKSHNATTERTICTHLGAVLGVPVNLCTYNDCRFRYICIGPTGEVYPCDRTYEYKYVYPNFKDFKVLTDYFHTDQYTLWYSMCETRQMMNCYSCPYFNVCGGGCRNTHYFTSKDDWTKVNTDECNRYRTFSDVLATKIVDIKDVSKFNQKNLEHLNNAKDAILPWEIRDLVEKYDLGQFFFGINFTSDEYKKYCKETGQAYIPHKHPLLVLNRHFNKFRSECKRSIMKSSDLILNDNTDYIFVSKLLTLIEKGDVKLPEEVVDNLKERECDLRDKVRRND